MEVTYAPQVIVVQFAEAVTCERVGHRPCLCRSLPTDTEIKVAKFAAIIKGKRVAMVGDDSVNDAPGAGLRYCDQWCFRRGN